MADQPLTYRDLKIEMTDLKADGTFKVRIIDEAPNGRTMRSNASILSHEPVTSTITERLETSMILPRKI